MRIVFSFDDGRIDAYEASKILSMHGLYGTFHITTGFIDGTYTTEDFGVGRMPLTISMIKQMASLGMEISSHGDKHIMDQNDFLVSVSKLNDMLGTKNIKRGFSVPNSKYNEVLLKKFVCNVRSNLLYVRVGRSKKCYSLVSKVHYFLYHQLHLYHHFKAFNKPNIIVSQNIFKIPSVVIKSDTNVKHIIKFINDYKKSNSTLILMFHSIVPTPKNVWEYKSSDFIKLCDYISSDPEIETIRMEDIAQ